MASTQFYIFCHFGEGLNDYTCCCTGGTDEERENAHTAGVGRRYTRQFQKSSGSRYRDRVVRRGW